MSKHVKIVEPKRPVDQWIVASLNRTKSRIEYALEEYQKSEMPLQMVEFNIRQSIHVLREVRKSLLHGGHY